MASSYDIPSWWVNKGSNCVPPEASNICSF